MRAFVSRAALSAAILCLGALSGPASAKTEEKPKAAEAAHVRYAHSFAEAMAEARERGCVVFATFHEDGWHFCVEMHRSVLEDKDFAEWAAENVIVLVGHPKGAHKSVDVAKPAKGEPKSQCSLYPGIACAEHEKAFTDATGKEPGGAKDDKAKPAAKAKPKKDDGPALPRLEVKGFPTSFIIGPDGTFESHGADRQPATCKDRLLEVQKKFEENPVPLSKWEAYKAAFVDGDKAWKDGKTKAALVAYAKVEADSAKLAKVVAERLKAKLDAVNGKAADRLSAIEKQPGEPPAKVKAIRSLRAELDVPLVAALPVVSDIDAWLAQNDPSGPPPASPSK